MGNQLDCWTLADRELVRSQQVESRREPSRRSGVYHYRGQAARFPERILVEILVRMNEPKSLRVTGFGWRYTSRLYALNVEIAGSTPAEDTGHRVGWALASLRGCNPRACGLCRFNSCPTH